MNRKIELVMGVMFLLAAALLVKGTSNLIACAGSSNRNQTIVLDAGHGGPDPGKVGVSGAYEKDINLRVAYKLKSLLESADYKVTMTRLDDLSLSSGLSTDNKAEDMKERCSIIENANPVFTISIHQNSYPSEEVKGAQTFYYGKSQEGKELAEYIQKSMIERVDKKNKREAKANESYYLLTKTPSATVIVECGFMSNKEEEKLLCKNEYQDKLAWAIFMGISAYTNIELN
ncbi:MAG: N-acetylmuramoyl-L-alanine amidase [Lachnospiraceae bacterium]